MADASGNNDERVVVKALRAAAVCAVFAIAIIVSVVSGTPHKLPGAAMGWDVLFHVLRASAVLGATGIVFLVGWRATHGEFPIKFGNVEYAVKDAAAEAKQASELQEGRIRVLEVLAGVRKPEDLEDDETDA